MPAKPPSSKRKDTVPTKQELAAIQQYLSQKPEFDQLLREQGTSEPHSVQEGSEYDQKLAETVESISQKDLKMPVMPDKNFPAVASEEKKESSSKDQQEKKLASTDDHKANLGPVMAQNLGEPASKEELKKRAEELNK